ncbi:hypothetical protein [Aquimarina mytili]|uniref:Uncharacterized protein n=1 Tax=Aquimarina mytili TaxID=874423 RepID=A0A937A0A9_9FLAO|nr:hypothetical protein [Aquimarina mytili]MBL0685641.1 hypothetical protein [Aquimarina mytili]
MRKCIVFGVAIILNVYCIGQEHKLNNLTVSTIDDKVQQQTTMSIGTIGDQYFSVHKKTVGSWAPKRTYTAVTYDQNLKKTNANVLVLKVGKNFTRYHVLKNIGEHLYLFSSYPTNKTHINTYYVREFDPKTLEPIGSEKPIAKIPYAEGGRRNSGAFWMDQSPDQSKIMVYYEMPWTRKGYLKFGIAVYDTTFNKLWEKEHEVPFVDKEYTLSTHAIDNDGNAYVAGRRTREDNKGYDFIRFTNNGTTVNTQYVEVPVGYVRNIDCNVAKNNQVVITGFASTGVREFSSGAYYHRFDTKTQEFVANKYTPFNAYRFLSPTTLVKASEFSKDDDTGVLSHISDYDKTILKEDGSAMIIAEEYYKYVRDNDVGDYTDNGEVTYGYDDVYIINISPEGEVLWARTIPKIQYTKNDYADYSSTLTEMVNDKLVLLFNDHIDNLNRDPKKKLKKFKGSKTKGAVAVMKYTIDEDGGIDKDTVTFDEDQKTFLNPWKSVNPNENELLFFTQKWGLLEKNKKYTLSRLK